MHRSLVGAGAAGAAGGTPARGLQSAGPEAAGGEVGGAIGPDGKGLLRGDSPPRPAGPGRVAERVHDLLGKAAAAYRPASDAESGSHGPAAGLPVVLCGGDVFGVRRGLPVGGIKGT